MVFGLGMTRWLTCKHVWWTCKQWLPKQHPFGEVTTSNKSPAQITGCKSSPEWTTRWLSIVWESDIVHVRPASEKKRIFTEHKQLLQLDAGWCVPVPRQTTMFEVQTCSKHPCLMVDILSLCFKHMEKKQCQPQSFPGNSSNQCQSVTSKMGGSVPGCKLAA